MRARCNDPNHISYHNYGARGIRVCARWDDFWLFVSDMGERPDDFTIDRVNSDDDYTPDNCVWASRSDQNKNRRRSLGAFKPSDDPMRYITKNRDSYCLQMSLGNGQRYRRYGLSLQEAMTLRDDTEVEREMYKRLV